MNELALIETPNQEAWYISLVDDCKAIITERLYRSRQEVIECWHEVGERIYTDANYQKYAKGNIELRRKLANDIGKSLQALYFAIQFFTKFPVLSNALETFPEGKNISWHKIVAKYLSEGGRGFDAEIKIDKALKLMASWGVETGQVWSLGKHRLVCGDCNDPDILLLAIRKNKPYLMLNDPPYGIGLDTDYSKFPSTKPEGNKPYSSIIGDDKPFTYNSFGLNCAEEFWFGADYYRKSIPDGGSWLVWDKRVEEKFDAMFGSAFELIWSKVKHKREIIRHNATLFSGSQEAKDKLHPTIKPIKVLEWIISKYSLREKIVIDCYAGAGTTILACENYGRKCIAIELEPKYVAVTLQRWLDATGIAPILLGE